MKRFSLIWFGLLILLLVGCSVDNAPAPTIDNTPVPKVVYKVVISKSGENGGKFDTREENEIKQFQTAVETAVQQPGVVDMASTEYQFTIGEDSYFLWPAREEGQVSTIMNVKDTNTIFTLSKKSTTEINEILKKHKLL